MNSLLVAPARSIDIPHLAATMREADQREIMASHGVGPEEGLTMGLEQSVKCWSICDKDHFPIGMFGVGRLEFDPTVGVPWLLASDSLLLNTTEFLRRTPFYLEEMFAAGPFRFLANYVDCRNEVSYRWLKYLGFKETKTIPEYGVGKIPFYFMVLERKDA